MLMPLPPGLLEPKVPVPINIWDSDGKVLLLRRGEVVTSEQQRQLTLTRNPTVLTREYRIWKTAYSAQLDSLVRQETSLKRIAEIKPPTDLKGLDVIEDEPRGGWSHDPLEGWHELHRALTQLLHRPTERPAFVERIEDVETHLLQLLQTRPDDSLLVLVQLLSERRGQAARHSYSAAHALMAAVLCQLVASAAGMAELELASLRRAALTMNIGMAQLQDHLTQHTGPLTPEHKQAIHQHPTTGAALLRQLEVRDAEWLRLVQEHHENESGFGYPAGKPVQDMAHGILKAADVFVARISPRASRRGLLPHMVARDVYLGPDGKPTAFGALFVKQLGMYLPGSYVRLVTGEVAIVVRRGRRANTPWTYAIVNAKGLPMAQPSLRDTHDPACEAKGSVAVDEVKVRVNLEQLLAKCQDLERNLRLAAQQAPMA